MASYDALEFQVIDQKGFEYIRYERIASVAIKRGLDDGSGKAAPDSDQGPAT